VREFKSPSGSANATSFSFRSTVGSCCTANSSDISVWCCDSWPNSAKAVSRKAQSDLGVDFSQHARKSWVSGGSALAVLASFSYFGRRRNAAMDHARFETLKREIAAHATVDQLIDLEAQT